MNMINDLIKKKFEKTFKEEETKFYKSPYLYPRFKFSKDCYTTALLNEYCGINCILLMKITRFFLKVLA